ncbi:MAG TPA: GMC family oxidoreductase [Anaerolineae bacterium]|nr:GMC family oxidoreductase [Anaerolineae bacterium]
MNAKAAAKRHWDCIIVGTGMGGATLGWALSRAGRSVLFLERGHHPLADEWLTGDYAEMLARRQNLPLETRLPPAGRWDRPLEDRSGRKPKTFIPFIGMGGGGSTQLYGAALERFFPEDFADWPIDYATLRPYYRRAEALYGVRGELDPLRRDVLDPLPAAGLDPANATIAAHLRANGLHPYRLPTACREGDACRDCQGYLCPKQAKGDAASICLLPALSESGAVLLDRCEVVRLRAGRTRVDGVDCRTPDGPLQFHSDCVVLAAGALHTPALLLRSAARPWPQGVANASGQVGRNLMRHAIDLFLVRVPGLGSPVPKRLAFNDFYRRGDDAFGTVQSFGSLPPLPMLLDSLHQDLRHALPWLAPLFPLARPFLRPALRALTGKRAVFAAILEDRPHPDNRIEPRGDSVRLYYRLGAGEHERLRQFRRWVARAFAPWPVRLIAQADNNERIAHACGTCRFGDDPERAVLDRDNRAHGLDNLYVVDASFFPTSAGINPALTIAANALRVADHLLNR